METSTANDTQGIDQIEHIVVLMMENRSFDHMLGYLRLEGVIPKLEGLQPGMGNEDPDGSFHEIKPLGTRLISEKVLDPGHGEDDIAIQLADRNGGFVKSYVRALEKNKQHYPYPPDLEFDPTLVLGYQRADDVPVYDYLARNWFVCDHWFSSVPGPTWENRLFALTGGLGPKSLPTILGGVPDVLKSAPLYDRPAFVRWLDEDDWRWYSHDPATLRLVDSRYRPGGEQGSGEDDNFSYFDRRTLFERRTFLDDAANGKLPRVSWVDPNFVDFRLFGPPGSNDDHPPSRVMLGQQLVLSLVVAVMESPQWPKTLLLITYDEHGGFFDHVAPGDFQVQGDPERSYGVRVPALLVSPYLDAGISHAVFDHTSIIKTILTRFSDKAEEGLQAMGERTQAARDLGELLTRPADKPRSPAPREELQQLADKVATWKSKAYRGHLLEPPTAGEKAFEAVSDLQRDIIGNAIALRQDGLPPGWP